MIILEPTKDNIIAFRHLWDKNCENRKIKLFEGAETQTDISCIDGLKDIKDYWWQEALLNDVFRDVGKGVDKTANAVILLDHFYHTRLQQNKLNESINRLFTYLTTGANQEKPLLDRIKELDYNESDRETFELYLRNASYCINEIMNAFKDDSIKNEKGPYSFATKFCNRLNPKAFPIYDSYVIGMLDYYYSKLRKEGRLHPDEVDIMFYREKLNKTALGNYKNLLILFHHLRKRYLGDKSAEFNFKDVDVFLWTYGKALEWINNTNESFMLLEFRELYPKQQWLTYVKNDH